MQNAMPTRRTKIVATIGPSSNSEEMLANLIESGVNVVRLNFSHGTHEEHAQVIERVRAISARLGIYTAIMQDLQGPKIRTGRLEGGQSVLLDAGASVQITTDDIAGTAERISTTYAGLPNDVKPGDPILLDDGTMILRVQAVHGNDITCLIEEGGLLKEHKGINLPGVAVSAPALTEKDRDDLDFGLNHEVDFVALSFVRRAQDLDDAHEIIAAHPRGQNTPLIAKLEKPQALQNLEAIIQHADGVMVARGDLAVELSPQQVPSAQKRIIEAANRHNRPVITATQMLESMTNSLTPTRAEVNDVANAIFDGTDAVMLSGETAVGHYPVETVKMMVRIALEAESHLNRYGLWHGVQGFTEDDAIAIAHAARQMADDRKVNAVIAFTRSGRTARLMSKTRPQAPILGMTPDPRIARRMSLYWGVIPAYCPMYPTGEEMVAGVEEMIDRLQMASPRDRVVIVGGLPAGQARTNFIRLHQIGDDRR